jgi:hypothetical protein
MAFVLLQSVQGKEKTELTLKVCAVLACVAPTETQHFSVTLVNDGTETVEAKVRLSVESGLNEKVVLEAFPLMTKAGKSVETRRSWNPAREFWGCRVVAETQIGDRQLTDTDVFSVSRNALAGSPICQTIMALNGNNARSRHRETVDRFRRTGSLLVEHFNWQASTWGPVYPRNEVIQAGMSPSGRTDTRELIRHVSGLVHERGMKFLTYAAPVFAGPEGCRWVKEHPEDVIYPTPNGKLPIENELGSTAGVNVLNRATLDQGIAEYVRCVKEFGYDGVRWDGHPGVFYHPIRDSMHRYNKSTALPGFDWKGRLLLVDDPDEKNIEIWHHFRDRFRAAAPNFLFGFNIGIGPEAEAGFNCLFPRAFSETVRGNMVIDETQMNAGNGDGVPNQVQNKTWSRARESLFFSSSLVRTLGGYVYRGPVYAACEPFAKHCYALFFAGATRVWGAAGLPEDWGRFALRYNRILFHPSLASAETDAKPGTRRPASKDSRDDQHPCDKVIYDLYTDGRYQRIVHFLRKPVSDAVNVKTTTAPAGLVTDARLSFRVPRGLRAEAARFFVLSPEWAETCQRATAKVEGTVIQSGTVNLPPFQYWAIAVMDVPVTNDAIRPPERAENWFLQIERDPQKPAAKESK